MQQLKLENDRAVVTIDGEEIAIEQALREGDDNDNTLSGTDDDDQIFAKGGNDSVDGGNGDDQITGLGGNDTIYGGAGNDRINGNDDNDKIFAQEGNDSVNGGNGDDQITGLGGNDTLDGGAGNDAINGDAGNDMIIGGAGNDSINGGDDNDTIFAKEGNDYVDGGNGNDQITGLDGNDILIGGAGNDAINGGSGNNQLYGGSGEDTFAVSNNANNTIHDFNSGENDKIDLTGGKFHTVVFDTQNSDTIITAKDSANTDFKTIATVKNTQLDNAIDSQDLVFVSESEKQALFPNLNTSVETIVPFIEEWTEKFAQSKGATESNLDLSGVNFAVTQAEVISTTESEPQFNLDQSNPIVNDGTGNLTRIKTVGSITTYNNTFTTESQVSLGTSTSIGSEQSANFTSQVDSSWENQTTVNAGGQIGGIGLSAENTTTFRGGESKTTEVGRIETSSLSNLI
ncbi:MAG: calcium-binding protein [Xenococcaceae cyanobacterium MO_234.B1]|nr:calcium-binding protein [Xenococcaceae cyanobacterium MO_234.B1]